MNHPEFGIDLENGVADGSIDQKIFRKLSDQFISVDDNLVKLSLIDPSAVSNGCPENILKVVIDSQMEVTKTELKKMGKEKRKKASSAKKPPKPPRGFSLDAADQKLIKEIAELAMIKRAGITRMNALKQKKALKASSSSSSSMSGSLFAMIFTLIFILMILLQGTSYRSSSSVTSEGSPLTDQTNENGLVFIQEQLNPSASDSILPHSKSSNLFEKITGSRYAGRKITVAE